jgi:hypothetical protein
MCTFLENHKFPSLLGSRVILDQTNIAYAEL